MATVAVQDAYVTLTSGIRSQQGAYTSLTGRATMILSQVTRGEYSIMSSLLADVTKSGYVSNSAQMTAFPSYDVARGSGIDLSVTLEKAGGAYVFFVSPTSYNFPFAGGSVSVTVTAPDSNWEVYNVSSGISVTAYQNGGYLMISVPPGTTGGAFFEGSVSVRHYNASSGWQYRDIAITRAADSSDIPTDITFFGTITDSVTGAAISNADVNIFKNNVLGTPILQGTTNTNGQYNMLYVASSESWGTITRLYVQVSKDTDSYAPQVKEISVPSYASAVGTGVSGSMALIKNATGTIVFRGQVERDTSRPVSAASVSVSLGTSYTSRITIGYANVDQTGGWRLSMLVNPDNVGTIGSTIIKWSDITYVFVTSEEPIFDPPIEGYTTTIPPYSSAIIQGVQLPTIVFPNQ